METFEIAAKKSRKRLTRRIVGWSTVVVLTLAGLYIAVHMVLAGMADQNRGKIQDFYSMKHAISYPNISYVTATVKPTSQFNSFYHMDRVKDLDGVSVPYDEVNASLGPTYLSVDATADGLMTVDKNQGAYTRGRLIKSPQFFNINVKETNHYPMQSPSKELPLVRKMTGQLVEVALTFDQSYTYEELQNRLPKNLKTNWYWIGTRSNYDTSGLPVSELYGLALDEGGEEAGFVGFKHAVKEFLSKKFGTSTYSYTNEKGEKVAEFSSQSELEAIDASYQDLKTAKFSGVILTGKAENFAQLENQDWIYASSIGASTANQPYYQLEKE